MEANREQELMNELRKLASKGGLLLGKLVNDKLQEFAEGLNDDNPKKAENPEHKKDFDDWADSYFSEKTSRLNDFIDELTVIIYIRYQFRELKSSKEVLERLDKWCQNKGYVLNPPHLCKIERDNGFFPVGKITALNSRTGLIQDVLYIDTSTQN